MDLVNAAQQQPGPEGTDMNADDDISDPQSSDMSAPSSSIGHQDLYIDKSGAHVPITPEQSNGHDLSQHAQKP